MVSKIGYGMAIPLHFLPNWNSILSTAYVYSGVGTFPLSDDARDNYLFEIYFFDSRS